MSIAEHSLKSGNSRYSVDCKRGQIFSSYAIVTASVIYSTAAGTGGPLLWNGSSGLTAVNCIILFAGWGITTASGAAVGIGLTGNTGQAAAPSSTTAIDATGNMFLGGAASKATTYRVGTPSSAGNIFIPFGDLDTGALTTGVGGLNWVDLQGTMVVPPGGWCSIACSATATTSVIQASLVWQEVPA